MSSSHATVHGNDGMSLGMYVLFRGSKVEEDR